MQDNSPVMKMIAKVPNYILIGMNGCDNVNSPARLGDQGTLMYSHDFQ
jgi:hypothetical protein